MKKYLTIIIVFVLIALLWQILEDKLNATRLVNGETTLELFFPSPKNIINSFYESSDVIISELQFTLFRALSGLLLGTLLAIIIETIIIFIPFTRNIILPITLGINSFPIVGFSPLIVLLFGQGSGLGIIFISMLICYFPTLITMDHGIRNIDSELLELMHIWKANKVQIFTKLQFPYALPYIITAMKLSIPASIIGATLGEWLGTKNGMGKLITLSFYQLKPGMMYASLITLMVVSLALTLLFTQLEKILIYWQKR
jgi:ABC-type nitrate/sulfonate/bicarbonate transport system permease component